MSHPACLALAFLLAVVPLASGQSDEPLRPEFVDETLRDPFLTPVKSQISGPLDGERLEEDWSREYQTNGLSAGTLFRPDLALVTAATGKLWLAAEVISSDDHRTDTVIKKAIYEDLNVPRLWMIDPRYNNVEVYHASPYGLKLEGILAGRETLREKLLPGLEISAAELFA